MEDSLKYTPTPRDLFNPPPQARAFNNEEQFNEIERLIHEIYPDCYDERQRLHLHVLFILREYDEHIFEEAR
jgi:hypothetical protein